jgi:hypothetical protein
LRRQDAYGERLQQILYGDNPEMSGHELVEESEPMSDRTAPAPVETEKAKASEVPPTDQLTTSSRSPPWLRRPGRRRASPSRAWNRGQVAGPGPRLPSVSLAPSAFSGQGFDFGGAARTACPRSTCPPVGPKGPSSRAIAMRARSSRPGLGDDYAEHPPCRRAPEGFGELRRQACQGGADSLREHRPRRAQAERPLEIS